MRPSSGRARGRLRVQARVQARGAERTHVQDKHGEVLRRDLLLRSQCAHDKSRLTHAIHVRTEC